MSCFEWQVAYRLVGWPSCARARLYTDRVSKILIRTTYFQKTTIMSFIMKRYEVITTVVVFREVYQSGSDKLKQEHAVAQRN